MAEEQFVNRRLWLLNAALRNTLGKDNPHEPVQDEYSCHIEDHVDELTTQLLEGDFRENIDKIWKNFDPREEVQRKTNESIRLQNNIKTCTKDPQYVYHVLINEIPEDSLLYEDVLHSDDILKTLDYILEDPEKTELSEFTRSIKNAQKQINHLKENCTDLIRDPLLIETEELIQEAKTVHAQKFAS